VEERGMKLEKELVIGSFTVTNNYFCTMGLDKGKFSLELDELKAHGIIPDYPFIGKSIIISLDSREMNSIMDVKDHELLVDDLKKNYVRMTSPVLIGGPIFPFYELEMEIEKNEYIELEKLSKNTSSRVDFRPK